ncbi:MAG: hypothetical protein ACK55I_09220, partial [bacterium]
ACGSGRGRTLSFLGRWPLGRERSQQGGRGFGLGGLQPHPLPQHPPLGGAGQQVGPGGGSEDHQIRWPPDPQHPVPRQVEQMGGSGGEGRQPRPFPGQQMGGHRAQADQRNRIEIPAWIPGIL